ncbi:hypothetical protein K438DRAFT_1606219, partial [Mycena galopus ATCC 62051]
HPEQFRRAFGVSRHVFLKLIQVLRLKCGLSPTKHVTSEEQVAIFLAQSILLGLSISSCAAALFFVGLIIFLNAVQVVQPLNMIARPLSESMHRIGWARVSKAVERLSIHLSLHNSHHGTSNV